MPSRGRRPHFNPRSPHGERPIEAADDLVEWAFQPTLPARGATCSRFLRGVRHKLFQPTLPARGATRSIEADGKREE